MVDEISFAISLTSVFLSILGILYEEFKSKVALEKRIATLESRPGTEQVLVERVAKMEVKMDLFWKTVEQYTITMLKHPNTTRFDDLLDKLQEKTITLAEMDELKGLLECEFQKVSKKKTDGRGLVIAITIARINTLMVDATSMAKMAMAK